MDIAYTFCAVFGGCFVLLQLIASFLMDFGDSDVSGGTDSDSGVSDSGGDASGDDASGDSSFSALFFIRMLSVRTVTAGLAFFGLAGLAGDSAGLKSGVTLLLALAAGVVALVLIWFVYRFISMFRYNGALSNQSLPGCRGTVHVRVPGKRAALGKVIVSQQERSVEYDAVTDSTETLLAGTPIVVVESISPSLVLVQAASSAPQGDDRGV